MGDVSQLNDPEVTPKFVKEEKTHLPKTLNNTVNDENIRNESCHLSAGHQFASSGRYLGAHDHPEAK